MTEEKRFELAYTKGDWWAVRDGEITLWKEEVIYLLNELHEENKRLKQENKKILDIIDNKITELGMEWYGAEDNSKEEKDANLQLNVLEEIRDELKVIFESN